MEEIPSWNVMLHNIYATPIYISNNNFNTLIDERVKLIRTTYDISNPWNDGAHSSFKNGKTKDCKIKHFNDLPEFIESISMQINNYILAVGGKNIKFSIDESWVNFTNKDEYQHFHMHPTYDIVGVYYFKANKNGYIQLENPVAVSEYSKFPNNISKILPVCIEPETGMLLLFPSWLRHAVYKNSTNEERISISFNIKINDT
jgi:uncharacterized protein (TIGR02466 family)